MSKRGWTEVRVLAPLGWQELVADCLAQAGWTQVVFGRSSLASEAPPEGFELVRSYLGEELEEKLGGEAAREALRARLAALPELTGMEELRSLEIVFRRLPPEDYATSWRRTWRPFRVGSLCVVTRDWAGALRPADRTLVLEPGGAFGTGRHATTRACLQALQERLAPGSRVLDAGSGSGILAVTAAVLGAREVLGFDVDEHAAPQARDLAEANDAAEECRFRTGDFSVLEPADTGFDAILANIYADVVQAHAGELAARLRPGGWFAFSGCRSDYEEATVAAVERAGLEVDEVRARGRWRTLIGVRPPREGEPTL